MNPENPHVGTKVHPASREMLPDDPLEMHATEFPGDPELMLRLLVEEYARIGYGLDAIMQLARDPNHQTLYALWRGAGEDVFRRCVAETLSRCGVIQIHATETQPISERLVQLDLPE